MNVGISYFDAYNFMANSYRRTTLASRALWYSSFPLTGEAQVTDPFLGKKKDSMISKKAVLPRMGSQRAIPLADIPKISPQRQFTNVDRVRYSFLTLVPTTFQISFMVSFRALTEPHCRITEEKKLYTLG